MSKQIFNVEIIKILTSLLSITTMENHQGWYQILPMIHVYRLWAKIPRISTMVTNTSAPPTLPATTPVWELVVSKQKTMFLLSPCVAKLNGFILTNQYYRNSYLCLEIKKSFFHKINIIYMGIRSNTWHFFQTNIH